MAAGKDAGNVAMFIGKDILASGLPSISYLPLHPISDLPEEEEGS